MSYTITASVRHMAVSGFGIVVTNTNPIPKKTKHPNLYIHLINVDGYMNDALDMASSNALFNNYVAMVDSVMLSYKSYPNRLPCIPHTYKTGQVVRSHLYNRLNAGKVVTYCLQSLLYDGQNSYGLTTDRHDVAPGAESSWDKFIQQNLYRERMTEMGYDEFDYEGLTSDTFDDCDAPDVADTFDVKKSYSLKPHAYKKNRFYIQQLIDNGEQFKNWAVRNVFPYRKTRLLRGKKPPVSLQSPLAKEFLLASELETTGNYFFSQLYPSRRYGVGGGRDTPKIPTIQGLKEELKRNQEVATRAIARDAIPASPFAELKLYK